MSDQIRTPKDKFFLPYTRTTTYHLGGVTNLIQYHLGPLCPDQKHQSVSQGSHSGRKKTKKLPKSS